MIDLGKVLVQGKLCKRDGELTRTANAALARALGPQLSPHWRSAIWETVGPDTYRLSEVEISIGATQVILINSELRAFNEAFPPA